MGMHVEGMVEGSYEVQGARNAASAAAEAAAESARLRSHDEPRGPQTQAGRKWKKTQVS